MLIVFDTETSGLQPGQICQLAYIQDDGECARGENLFFTVDHVERSALAVHGFTPEYLRRVSGGKGFAEHAEELQRVFGAADIVAGHNLNFDVRFLKTELERVGRELNYGNGLCTMYKFTKTLGILGRSGKPKPPKLTELMAYFQIGEAQVERWTQALFRETDERHAHDARYDATATWLCLHAAMQQGAVRKLVG